MITSGYRRRRRSAGVSLPTPTAYYNFNSNGNDGCASPANLATYSSGGAGLLGNCNTVTSSSTFTTGTTSKFSISGGDWTIAFWSYVGVSALNANWLMRLTPNIGSFPNANLWLNPLTGVRADYQPDNKHQYITSLTANAPSLLTWNLAIARYTGGNLYASLNSGTEVSIACPGVSLSSPKLIWNNTSLTLTYNIDEAAVWIGTALDSTQRTTLYNSGAGRTYNGSAWV